ncbi:MAG: cytochrome c family protein [gamma proteobacterium symbiont of Taylorina sp.]|nr:cytochrome c family protein [gamma proteobacterium symbiont of Taylorina sp.]
MKKWLLYSVFFIIFGLMTVTFFNPSEIYELTQKTAQFIPYQEIPEGLVSLKAKDCGVCHTEIYREWKTSLHAKAYTDPFFTAYHKKDDGDPTCLVCHTPLENQSPIILSSESGQYNDLKSTINPDFDAELQQEGVTCASCHVKDGVIYGSYKKKDMNAPHPVAYADEFFSKSLCQRCHEVPSKSFALMNEGICSTGMESNRGVWAARGYICQDCHMPVVNRPLMSGFPSREGKKHLWPGGYSNRQLQNVFTFKAKKELDHLAITITNSGAGHKAPTGDPDRFIVLDFIWLDKMAQETVLESIEFKRTIIWQPVMFVWSDNRLSPGESTVIKTKLPENDGTLVVNGTYHVMTDRSLNRLKDKFELKDEWPIHRSFLKNQKVPVE